MKDIDDMKPQKEQLIYGPECSKGGSTTVATMSGNCFWRHTALPLYTYTQYPAVRCDNLGCTTTIPKCNLCNYQGFAAPPRCSQKGGCTHSPPYFWYDFIPRWMKFWILEDGHCQHEISKEHPQPLFSSQQNCDASWWNFAHLKSKVKIKITVHIWLRKNPV